MTLLDQRAKAKEVTLKKLILTRTNFGEFGNNSSKLVLAKI